MTNSTSLTATLSECITTYQTRPQVYALLRRRTGYSSVKLGHMMRKAGVEFPERLAQDQHD